MDFDQDAAFVLASWHFSFNGSKKYNGANHRTQERKKGHGIPRDPALNCKETQAAQYNKEQFIHGAIPSIFF